jgi:hypothetical protein
MSGEKKKNTVRIPPKTLVITISEDSSKAKSDT